MTPTFAYQDVAARAVAALRNLFGPDAGIYPEEGYGGRVRVKVVSPRLNGKAESEKQDLIWQALRDSLQADAQAVAFVIGYGTDEL